jgi:hypothetical protein
MSGKKESIKHYSLKELQKLREQGNTGTDWGFVLNQNQAEADKIASADDIPWGDNKFWQDITLADSSKKLMGFALEPEVASFYQKLGINCQETINSVLKAYMLVQEKRV